MPFATWVSALFAFSSPAMAAETPSPCGPAGCPMRAADAPEGAVATPTVVDPHTHVQLAVFALG